MANAMVSRCPVCSRGMVVSELTCESCGTTVGGRFEIPELCRLPRELYDFLLVFVKNRGVIREVERELGISYPTVRSRLDAAIVALGFGEVAAAADRDDVLARLERDEISAEEAERMLRGDEAEED